MKKRDENSQLEMLEGARSEKVIDFFHILSKYIFVILIVYTTSQTLLMCLIIFNNWGVPIDFELGWNGVKITYSK